MALRLSTTLQSGIKLPEAYAKLISVDTAGSATASAAVRTRTITGTALVFIYADEAARRADLAPADSQTVTLPEATATLAHDAPTADAVLGAVYEHLKTQPGFSEAADC